MLGAVFYLYTKQIFIAFLKQYIAIDWRSQTVDALQYIYLFTA